MINSTEILQKERIKKLRDVCTFIGGGTPSKDNKSFWNGDIPWASIKDVKGKHLLQTSDFISEEGLKNSATNLVQPNEIILATRINPGRTIISKIITAINQDLKIVRPKADIDTLYLYYAFLNYEREILKLSSGTTVKGITLNLLNDIEFVIPDLIEQKVIVSKIEELFSDIDKGNEDLKIAQQQLKIYRQSVLKWAFEGKLTNENVKNGKLPNSWKWATVGDICKNVEYGSATKSKKSGKMPVLRMGNIQNGIFDWSDLVYSDDEKDNDKYLLKKNDVLFNRTNSAELVGKTAIYKGERPAIFAGYLIRINRIADLIDSQYLTYYLNTHAARSYGNQVRSFGVNQSNINGTKLKTYPIPLPLLEEQIRVVLELERRLSVADKMEESIKESLQQAETLRQSILKKAFSGELI